VLLGTKFEFTTVIRTTPDGTLWESSGEHGEVASRGDYRDA